MPPGGNLVNVGSAFDVALEVAAVDELVEDALNREFEKARMKVCCHCSVGRGSVVEVADGLGDEGGDGRERNALMDELAEPGFGYFHAVVVPQVEADARVSSLPGAVGDEVGFFAGEIGDGLKDRLVEVAVDFSLGVAPDVDGEDDAVSLSRFF